MGSQQLESVGIRRAELDDRAGLVEVSKASGATVGKLDLAGWMGDPEIFTYVAEDSQLFGYITAGPPRDALFSADTGEVYALCVLPEYWGQGIGRKLVVHGISVLKRRHFNRVVVWLPAEAERARRMLRGLKFSGNGMNRETNLPGQVLWEEGFELDASDYF